MTDRFNIIYLHSHDTGRCMQPYGYPVAMPAYQQLAERGMVFRSAFSAAPTCSPSRAALLTGQAPHSNGMMGLAHRGFRLADPNQHLAALLRRNGYRTVLAGHQHVTQVDPRTLGYDVVMETAEVPGERIAANAASFLRTQSGAEVDTPFFLDIGFTESHRPFLDPDPKAAKYLSVLPGMPDTADIRLDVAGFHASLRALDAAVGTVLRALDESGLAEKTIVLLTTDHGPPFPGMKATLTDWGLGVGLIVRVPGISTPGSVSEALVSQIDLYPTLCDLVGIARPTWLQGRTLLPVIEGVRNEVQDAVFGEVTFHAAYEPQRSIRTNRWRYIRRFEDRDRQTLPNIDASPALSWLLEHSWNERPRARVQLYDCALDPLQKVNLAETGDFVEIEDELWKRLEKWMIETSDPLLAGPVPLPDGAVANRASDMSPDGELVSDLKG